MGTEGLRLHGHEVGEVVSWCQACRSDQPAEHLLRRLCHGRSVASGSRTTKGQCRRDPCRAAIRTWLACCPWPAICSGPRRCGPRTSSGWSAWPTRRWLQAPWRSWRQESHADLDPFVLHASTIRVTRTSFDDLLGRVGHAPPALLEVTEPLWAAHWPDAARLARAARAGGAVTATYAIDALPPLGGWPRDLDILDAVVFGTVSAAELYAEAPEAQGWQTRVVEERRDCAGCFGHAPPIVVPASREVVFAAELRARKGIDLLMGAWEELDVPGWCLRVFGWGEWLDEVLAWSAGRADVEVVAAGDRATLHAALCRAAVVVLPSRRVAGWREQVGLSLVEGLAHGCRLVTTTESGIAAGLQPSDGHRVVVPDDRAALGRGLREALTDAPTTKVLPRRVGDSRVEATTWLAGLAGVGTAAMGEQDRPG